LRRELTWNEGEAGFTQAMKDSREALVIACWSAVWCRKCKFLKAKLEKFAHWHPDLVFSVLDVNTIPQAIVQTAGVTQMPTLQIYRNEEMVAEIIGSDDADRVIAALRKTVEELQQYGGGAEARLAAQVRFCGKQLLNDKTRRVLERSMVGLYKCVELVCVELQKYSAIRYSMNTERTISDYESDVYRLYKLNEIDPELESAW
jgi:thiol-disulfide isomerase/thioredoxin